MLVTSSASIVQRLCALRYDYYQCCSDEYPGS